MAVFSLKTKFLFEKELGVTVQDNMTFLSTEEVKVNLQEGCVLAILPQQLSIMYFRVNLERCLFYGFQVGVSWDRTRCYTKYLCPVGKTSVFGERASERYRIWAYA